MCVCFKKLLLPRCKCILILGANSLSLVAKLLYIQIYNTYSWGYIILKLRLCKQEYYRHFFPFSIYIRLKFKTRVLSYKVHSQYAEHKAYLETLVQHPLNYPYRNAHRLSRETETNHQIPHIFDSTKVLAAQLLKEQQQNGVMTRVDKPNHFIRLPSRTSNRLIDSTARLILKTFPRAAARKIPARTTRRIFIARLCAAREEARASVLYYFTPSDNCRDNIINECL